MSESGRKHVPESDAGNQMRFGSLRLFYANEETQLDNEASSMQRHVCRLLYDILCSRLRADNDDDYDEHDDDDNDDDGV